eukprot:3066633-Rhodomonas_salina.1
MRCAGSGRRRCDFPTRRQVNGSPRISQRPTTDKSTAHRPRKSPSLARAKSTPKQRGAHAHPRSQTE